MILYLINFLAEEMLSKNGLESFSKNPVYNSRTQKENIFTAKPGIATSKCNDVLTPFDSFQKIISKEIVSDIVKFTNKYAKSVKNDYVSTTIDEIYTLFGILLFNGIFSARKEKISEIWSKEL